MSTTAQSSGRHLSIGEVLAQLRDDFPDVTISKIRFLESQGLIDPERTPSGYRKFYAPDLARLRWILGQQRDHFLPLREIRARLDAFGPTGAPPGDSAREPQPDVDEPGAPTGPEAPEPRDQTPTPFQSIRELAERPLLPAITSRPEPIDQPRPSNDDVPPSQPSPRPPQAAPAEPPRAAPPAPVDLPFDDFVDEVEEETEGLGEIARSDTVPGTSGMSRAELLEATGLGEGQLDALEEYGIVTPLAGDGERALYDDEALTLGELAAGYYSRGIEARHLKMYQHFSEREAALFSQVLVHYVRQRNPKSRARLQEELEELARLGRRLRTAMLRRALGKSLTE